MNNRDNVIEVLVHKPLYESNFVVTDSAEENQYKLDDMRVLYKRNRTQGDLGLVTSRAL